MAHAHLLRSFLEPQRTKHPAVPIRTHYQQTDAYYRGQHQLQAAVGSRHSHLPSLCNLHNFEGNQMNGTIEILNSNEYNQKIQTTNNYLNTKHDFIFQKNGKK